MKTKRALNLKIFITLAFSLCALFLLTGCESRRNIVNALEEKEANEILVFLSNKGIDAWKVLNTDVGGTGAQKIVLWNISVLSSESKEAMSLLNQSGLPRRRGQSLLSIFAEGGLVPSEMQERIKYQAGLAEQIASTIRKIDGVLDSEVQISFPEDDPLNPGKTKGDITASVYVKHSGVLDDPNTHLLTKIKRLVTASVTGLRYDNVTVIGDRARFSDFPIGLQAAREADREYVYVWSVIVAKESLTVFRVIFFSFTILTLILFLFLVWISWKVYPILKQHGGLYSLLNFTPLVEEVKPKEEGEEGEEEEGEEEEKEEEDVGPPKDVT